MAIISKAPLRISFAGGGTDLEPFCTTHGGCVLSATINQYAYVKIESNPSLSNDTWIFCSPDLNEENIVTGAIGDWNTDKSTLLINAYKHMHRKYQFELLPVKITGYCEAPPGSGLGSSSAYTVATVSAINRYYALGLSKYDIADVSHYVKEKTLLDEEAYQRGTSVYLVDRVVPMLPEILSNNVCSLRPNEEKLTFSAVFEMDAKAHIINQWFGRTVILSDHRFTYEEAQEIIENSSQLDSTIVFPCIFLGHLLGQSIHLPYHNRHFHKP